MNRESAVYVCVCNGVTDHQIREAAAAGCGSCVDTAVALLEDEAASRRVLQVLPLANAA